MENAVNLMNQTLMANVVRLVKLIMEANVAKQDNLIKCQENVVKNQLFHPMEFAAKRSR